MFEYAAQVVRVVDGDTLDVVFDLGFGVTYRSVVRLYGINTPETHGPKAKVEGEAGKNATQFVNEWLGKVSGRVRIRSYDARPIKQEKYGRWLGAVVREGDTTTLNDALVEAGHAKRVTY